MPEQSVRPTSGASPVQYNPRTEDKTVLGIPFGPDNTGQKHLAGIREKLQRLLLKLQTVNDPQVELALLRWCLGAQRVTHILRVLPSPAVDEFVNDVERDLRTAAETLLGTGVPDSAWLQCSLPLLCGRARTPEPQVHWTCRFYVVRSFGASRTAR